MCGSNMEGLDRFVDLPRMSNVKSQMTSQLSTMDRTRSIIERAPRASVALLSPEQSQDLSPVSFSTMESVQRRRLKLYRKGDMVEAFSARHQAWFQDAEIAHVVKESITLDGKKVRAGSMKVVYDNGSRFKWVPPQQMDEFIRPSQRPKLVERLVGEFSEPSEGWFGTTWTKVYFELNKGFLQWWNTLENAKAGGEPAGSIHLLGLTVQEDGNSIKVKSLDTEGEAFTFQLRRERDVARLITALYSQAGYCEEVREYCRTQDAAGEEECVYSRPIGCEFSSPVWRAAVGGSSSFPLGRVAASGSSSFPLGVRAAVGGA